MSIAEGCQVERQVDVSGDREITVKYYDVVGWMLKREHLEGLVQSFQDKSPVPDWTVCWAGTGVGGAVLVGALVAADRDYGLIIQSNDEGAGEEIVGKDRLPEGIPIIMVDTVVTTGERILRMRKILERNGLRASRAMVVLGQGKAGVEALNEKGITVEVLEQTGV